jgi:hypothetical protein
MDRIELNHDHVSGRVEAAGIALNQLSLHAPSGQGVGHLAITNDPGAGKDGSSAYIAIHRRCAQEPRRHKDNVDLLKRQDEVIK